MQSMLPQLVCACTVSIVGAALDAHVRSAKERGWGHPVQLPRAGSDDGARPLLQVRQADTAPQQSIDAPCAAPLQHQTLPMRLPLQFDLLRRSGPCWHESHTDTKRGFPPDLLQ